MFGSTYNIVWYLIWCSLATPIRATQEDNTTLSMPKDWDTLCPYTDFCTHKASQSVNLTRTQKPCCEPCSCDAECGLKRNCCLYSMDTYRLDEKYQTTCTSLYTDLDLFGLLLSRKMYMTVDTCPNMTSCYDFKAAPWGSMYPVVSGNSSMIYLNEKCAACHGDNNITKWKTEVNCHLPQALTFFLTDGLRNALFGNPVDPVQCSLQFLPPKHVDVSFQSCFHESATIRTCKYEHSNNATYELKEMCASVNSTYVGGRIAYSNVFCYLCSTPGHPTVEDVCVVDDESRSRKTNTPFSTLLQLDDIMALGSSSEDTNNGETQHGTREGCRPREIKEKKTGRCRKLRCVAGQTEIAEECLYLGDYWTVGPFVAYIKLEPLNVEDRVPVEQIDKLRSYKGTLFRTHIQHWSRELFHHILRNDSFIQYFVLRVYHGLGNVHPVKFFDEFKTSLETTWTLKVNKKTYQMKASFAKFNEYLPCINNENIQSSCYVCRDKENAECDEIVSVMMVVKKMPKYRYSEYISLTEHFYCDQVDLKAEEFDDYGQRIYFRVTGRYLENAEFRRIPVVGGNDTVSICLSKFGDDFWLYQNSKSVAQTLIFDTEYIIIIVFISRVFGVLQSVSAYDHGIH